MMILFLSCFCSYFFLNDTATTEIYTLSLHDALPISERSPRAFAVSFASSKFHSLRCQTDPSARSEEHTSELQSHSDLVCRLLLEKKKRTKQLKPTSQEKRPARQVHGPTRQATQSTCA